MLNRIQMKKQRRTVIILLTMSLFFCLRYFILYLTCMNWQFSWFQVGFHSVSCALQQKSLIFTQIQVQISVGLIEYAWVYLSIYVTVICLMNICFSSEDMMFAYLLCHLVGVTTTVTNPILYAMLNYNFQKEFQTIVARIKGIFVCPCSFRGQETETET